MRRIVEKSILTGLFSVSATLALSSSIVPLLDGRVAGAGLFMTIFCPLAISIPASALHLCQSERVRRAEAETAQALKKLADAYDTLRVQSRRDGLTGVLTRAALMEDLETISQHGVPGGLMFLDLDYFNRSMTGMAMQPEMKLFAALAASWPATRASQISRAVSAVKNLVCFKAI